MEKITKQENPIRGGCMHCPGNHDLLELDTVLYNGFGGYAVSKNGVNYYCGEPDQEWESFKTLQDIENEAVKDPEADWRVELNLPLRSGEWQRHGDSEWVLIDSGLGFA